MTVRVIAELGVCHGGSMQAAIAAAHAAKAAGAWGLKIQLYKADKIASRGAAKYWTDETGTVDQNEAFRGSETADYAAWETVKKACDEIGLVFLATPFDIEAVNALQTMGCRVMKIASGDITNRDLLQAAARASDELIISTGASDREEIRRAAGWVSDANPHARPFSSTWLACTLCYPCRDEDADLARITTLRILLGLSATEVGYSDHTLGTATAMGATILGATVLEKHFTLTPEATDVPDHAMALDPARLADYVAWAQLGERFRGAGRLEPLPCEMPARTGARRSLHAARDIPEGKIIEAADLVALRPAGGLAPPWIDVLVGKPAACLIPAGWRIVVGREGRVITASAA